MDVEALTGLQEAVNDAQSMMNTLVGAAGGVRQQAITAGFGEEAADLIGVEAFMSLLANSFARTEAK